MTAPLQAASPVVANIERLLRGGKSAQWIASNTGEPLQLVVQVLERLQAGESPRPQLAAAGAPSADAPSIDALVAAAGRSSSRRTRTMAEKLTAIAGVLRTRLAEERAEAEGAEQRRQQELQARERIAKLEQQLRDERAKLRKGKPRKASSTPRPPRQRVAGEHACRKGCGKVSPSPQGRAAHERFCGGAS